MGFFFLAAQLINGGANIHDLRQSQIGDKYLEWGIFFKKLLVG